ncbi:MAG: aldo/keto reductase [Pseudomonadota bacterium]
MNYRLLGRTGIRVSPLCFGAMSFGAEADEAISADLYKTVREAGINFIDCADGYTKGAAETILGNLMAHERDELVITTKVFSPMYAEPNSGGSSRRHITRAVEDSLHRLRTDRVEVLFLHHHDGSLPLEEKLRTMEDLVRSGKALHVGISNYSAWQIALGLGIQDRHGWSRTDVLQPMYSLVKRQVEVEILPLAADQGLGVITYSPIGAGLLSGKYRGQKAGQGQGAGRLGTNERYAKRYSLDAMQETADAFVDYAEAKGIHPVTLAVAWVGSNPAITAPIIGARSVEQIQPALAAAEFDMTPDMRAEITALSPPPPSATDRIEEAN